MGLKPCLLVVDDEPDLVQSVKDLLRFDFRVLGATRASEGLKIVENESVQVVMTDQRMPEMTGVEFLACLRDRQPDTVRLLFTAFSDLQAVTDAINQGNVYRYITKPFRAEELKAILKQAVDHYNLQADRKRLLQEVQEKNRQLQAANRELLQANELKRAFIKVASHELRTPLTIVCGLAELAASSGQPMQAWLEQIQQASQRLRSRVDQMVEFLQSETFAWTLATRDVDFATLVNGAADEVRGFASRRKQRLVVDVQDGSGTLRVDAEKIHDSLVQLLVNAVKFTPDEGTITLSTRRTDAAAVITVQDSGTGIEPECLPHVFDPFFTRFDVSRHCSGTFEFNRRGLGLGLAVAKAFVEMHGGRLGIESVVGRGTTVTITLPEVTGESETCSY
jgi:signal transduction histidine kinase